MGDEKQKKRFDECGDTEAFCAKKEARKILAQLLTDVVLDDGFEPSQKNLIAILQVRLAAQKATALKKLGRVEKMKKKFCDAELRTKRQGQVFSDAMFSQKKQIDHLSGSLNEQIEAIEEANRSISEARYEV